MTAEGASGGCGWMEGRGVGSGHDDDSSVWVVGGVLAWCTGRRAGEGAPSMKTALTVLGTPFTHASLGSIHTIHTGMDGLHGYSIDMGRPAQASQS